MRHDDTRCHILVSLKSLTKSDCGSLFGKLIVSLFLSFWSLMVGNLEGYFFWLRNNLTDPLKRVTKCLDLHKNTCMVVGKTKKESADYYESSRKAVK